MRRILKKLQNGLAKNTIAQNATNATGNASKKDEENPILNDDEIQLKMQEEEIKRLKQENEQMQEILRLKEENERLKVALKRQENDQ